MLSPSLPFIRFPSILIGPWPETYKNFPTTKTGLYTPAGFGAGGKLIFNSFTFSDGKFFIFYINIFNISTPINPVIPTIVSITVHVDKVSFTVRLKYSLNIQNPASLT